VDGSQDCLIALCATIDDHSMNRRSKEDPMSIFFSRIFSAASSVEIHQTIPGMIYTTIHRIIVATIRDRTCRKRTTSRNVIIDSGKTMNDSQETTTNDDFLVSGQVVVLNEPIMPEMWQITGPGERNQDETYEHTAGHLRLLKTGMF
jgi:hypothetical protein